MSKQIKRNGYTVRLSDPILHVDNESRGRSGHMSHAIAEFAPGRIIDFNSNCSAVIHQGHSTFGFLEYRISEDGGESFSEPRVFPYSMKQLLDGIHTVSLEKMIALENGKIITFCLLNDAHALCEPWFVPPVCITSEDGGESFEELCIVPTDTMGRSYASIIFDAQDKMHFYIYNVNAEHDPDHLVSDDYGKTFHSEGTCHLAKGSRNIQTARIGGIFVLHCRGEEINRNKFPLYTSLDGYHWDEGEFIDQTDFGTCFYSNNLLLKDENGNERLLLQYSHSYFDKCVNVRHMWLSIEKNAEAKKEK